MASRAHPPELLTPRQMLRADQLALQAGATGLMDAAGWAVARAARRFGPCRTLVLCGPGNNGGDGYVAARLLAAQGWPVAVAALAPPRPGSDADRAARNWHGPNVAFMPDAVQRADLVIDAVFGAGLSRPIEDRVAETLRAARRVLAVDVPSGLDGATGAASGEVRRADLTVTFFRLKPGHLLLPGRELCGDVVLADIGIPASVLDEIRPDAVLNSPLSWRLPRSSVEANKYARGHVTVLGGAVMTGAARLAAGAARRGGAGMVTISAAGGGDVYRTGEPGLIVSEADLPSLLEDERRTTWVCGPGLGVDRVRETLPLLLRAGRRVVGDADLFSAYAGDADGARGCAVLTPHAGEFRRLFGDPGPDRVAAVRAAAARIGGVVVLKGSDTIVAGPDGRVSVNDSAPPWLASAGSGDVLAGLVAALLANGMPAWDAACAGVWLHGRAGALAGPGMIAEDLLPNIAGAVAEAG